MTWEEICRHPDLQELPFRIESNRWGHIVMIPPHNDHGSAQSSIFLLLHEKMRGGVCRQETNITTAEGVRVADASWQSDEFKRTHKGEASYSRAPEIVIEVRSPSNAMSELLEKKELFLQAGAREVWIRKENGEMLFYDAEEGLRERSRLCPDFPSRVEV